MASITIVYRKDKINKKGEAPIHFRIIKDRKVRHVSAQTMLELKYWDFKRNKVKSTYTNSVRLNNYLSAKYAEYQAKLLEAETHRESKNVNQIRESMVKRKGEIFFDFADLANQVYLVNNQIGTYDKSRSIVQKLRDYMNGKQLLFTDMTPSFLTKYENYLRTELENGSNTILRDMKFISKLFNDAYAQELIEHRDNPFLRYKKPKEEKAKKEYLSEKELASIELLDLKSNSAITIHKDIFIFSCYAGGERISDLLTLRWKEFDGKHINFSTTKTETQLSILLPDKAIKIVKRYRTKDRKNAQFIFPVLPNDLDMKNPRSVDGAISRATALMNKNLKVIAKRAGIDKNVSTHTARHTWATRALRKGISIDKVSKILGHTNLKQTQVYAKIVSSELDKAMQVFNE